MFVKMFLQFEKDSLAWVLRLKNKIKELKSSGVISVQTSSSFDVELVFDKHDRYILLFCV